jgi:hypothetical protein
VRGTGISGEAWQRGAHCEDGIALALGIAHIAHEVFRRTNGN